MAELTALDRKINAQFPGAVVRKDLVTVVKRQCDRAVLRAGVLARAVRCVRRRGDDPEG